jgi:hypothetical protein
MIGLSRTRPDEYKAHDALEIRVLSESYSYQCCVGMFADAR